MSRILITGAGGFVGSHAMAAFGQAMRPGDRLAGIGRSPAPRMPPGSEHHTLDLLDEAATSDFVATFQPTHVLHLAAMSSVHQSAGTPGETWRANVCGLLNLAEAVSRMAAEATFVFVSSGEVYGRAFLSGAPISETTQPQPANAYARTKLVGEQMLADVFAPSTVKLIVARPFNHIGRGQDERFVVPSFAGQIARIEAGLSPPVLDVGDLSARRDFLDVADVVSAYVMLMARSDEIEDRATLNISSGVARPISEMLDALRSMSRVPFDIRVAQDRLRPSEIPTASGDHSEITRVTGWRPSVALTASLADVLDEARSTLAVRRDQE